MTKNVFKHLGIEDRRVIEEAVSRGEKARALAQRLGVSASTVAREVSANRVSKAYAPTPSKHARDLCARYDACAHYGDLCGECGRNEGAGRCRACSSGRCFERCRDFLAGPRCAHVLRWPHTCDLCASAASCTKARIFYRAESAQAASDGRKSAPRRGICCTPGQIASMDGLVTGLLKKGQSPAAIWADHASELPVSARTYYRYLEAGLTDAIPLDLPSKVRRRPRRKGKEDGRDRIDRTGRTYEDFCGLSEEVRMSAWQMDTVIGRADNGKRILSLELPRISYQPYLLLAGGDASGVVAALDSIELLIGSPEGFEAAIPVLLVDRGREFDDWEGMERSRLAEGRRRCRVFYADPQRPDQKGSCERNHRELRRILPKGRSDFDALSPWDVALACSHVNSYPRPALGGARPIDLAALVLPEALTAGLGICAVPADEVTMSPSLLPHATVR